MTDDKAPADAPLLIGVRDAAKRLGVGRETAYSLARTGALPSVRIGRRILIPADALAKWVDAAAARADANTASGWGTTRDGDV